MTAVDHSGRLIGVMITSPMILCHIRLILRFLSIDNLTLSLGTKKVLQDIFTSLHCIKEEGIGEE